MAIDSYDIVSTLQALGMMKYWKGKHIILKKQVRKKISTSICLNVWNLNILSLPKINVRKVIEFQQIIDLQVLITRFWRKNN